MCATVDDGDDVVDLGRFGEAACALDLTEPAVTVKDEQA